MTLPKALRDQAQHCAALGSPFMEKLLTMLADSWSDTSALARHCAQWEGDIGPMAASLPLRIAGGLHALILTDQDADLASVYPPNMVNDDRFRTTVMQALERNIAFMADWMENAPQTNEVRRSAALIPAAHVIAARYPLPFKTSELGASAGLNMMWDRFAVQTDQGRLGPDDAVLTLTPDWTGPLPAAQPITVANRAGVDLNPIDCHAPDQALRLFSYLWPDQPERMALTRAAMAAQDTPVEQGDAIDWLDLRLAERHQGQAHLIYHTIAWQYFPPAVQDHGTALIEAAGARATEDEPLAWLSLEADGSAPGAALTLRLWPGDIRLTLGRACFHGRWVNWVG